MQPQRRGIVTAYTSVPITALDGGRRDLDGRALKSLADDLKGALLRPEDEGYSASVALWNGMITKRPAVVVRAESVDDVVSAVRFAAEHEIELSIRGGGHNIAGLALTDGGMTLDMSGRRGVEVDSAKRLARVEAGALLGDVDRATQEHGLAATLGFVSLTGIGGLTLGGGFGYLSRRFGWTVDDLEAVEVVLADGSIARASRSENADLFWALRGGGGNFGVVTEFTFRLHDVGPQITGGPIAWPASEAERVLDAFRDVTDSAPRELTLVAVRRNAPPAPWLPESAHGTPVVVIVACHSGDAAQAEADLAPITSLGEPLANMIQLRDYTAQQSFLDATQPKGNHFYWKSEFLPGLSDELISTYHAQVEGLTAPANQVVLFHLEGALNEHPEDDGAVGNRDARFACVIQSMWTPESSSGDANRAWVRDAWQALKPFSTGGNYINFQTSDEPDERTRASFRSNYDRLADVKARYDPTNLFRVNRNIR